MKNVVVTGVSSGIGWGITKVLLNHGFRVFGSVRQQKDAERLQAEFGAAFTPLLFDTTDEDAVRRAAAEVEHLLAGENLAGLVNNVGIALAGPLLFQPLEIFRQQVEVNLMGPFVVTQAFASLLRAKGNWPAGRLVNMSSVGGKIGPPFLGAYAASKHGLEGLSETLRRELLPDGIDVIIVAPGSVATPIWDKAETSVSEQYAATPYAKSFSTFLDYMIADGRKGLAPERIGEVVFQALTVARPSVRYAVVPKKLLNWILPNLLPRRWVDRLIAKQAGLQPVPPAAVPA
jgi:NAD(P)-dependent dehydrogenase (short-subunit alcohol dehydrogenase family)